MNNLLHLRDVLDYVPVASRFGTSGVRALVKDLTDLEVYCLSLGTLQYLEAVDKAQVGGARRAPLHIPIGGDLRPSTSRILGATARAILDAGYQLDYVGTLPTPALTFYALESGILSFMCTGSHIPADRNGQKANRCDGEVLKSDEQGIVEAVEAVRQREYDRAADESKFDSSGMLKPKHRVSLPPVNPSAETLYFDRYRQVFPKNGLAGQRILFYEYSAVGRELLPRILEHLGADVIRAGRSDEFIPIDTEAISEAHLQMLSQIVADQQGAHGRIDAVVSTDGDSDRPLILGVSEPSDGSAPALQFFPGDLVGALVADYLVADSVSVPISASPAVHEHFLAKGLTTTKTRIGSPFVIQAMQKALAEGKQRVVGWEANGGFLVGAEMTLNEGTLRPLPTRDAVLPILAVLYAAADQSVTLGELFGRLPRWYGRADLIDNFPQDTSRKFLAYFRPPVEDVQWLEFHSDRILLRNQSETIVGEWPSDDPNGRAFHRKRQVLEGIFTQAGGFGGIERINVQDGIRCFFGNGDIAHIRPSGNAPQLRIYAQARTQARASRIADMAVAEPDGILRDLQRFIESAVGDRSL
jgi:phosphomannomutase